MRLFIRSILVMKSTKLTAAIVTPPADTMLPEKENKGSRSQSKNADKEHYKAHSPRRHPLAGRIRCCCFPDMNKKAPVIGAFSFVLRIELNGSGEHRLF